MLVLDRKRDQTIVINGNIRIKILNIRPERVKLGIEAPKTILILREELIGRSKDGE